MERKGFNLSRTSTYYRLLPANVCHKDGKRHAHNVTVKLWRPLNDLQKKPPDGYLARASVKFAKELATSGLTNFQEANCYLNAIVKVQI